MSVGSHLSDFVGYDVGIPTTATVGYVGFLDFVGFPVGLGTTPPTPTPTVPKGGGTIINIHHRVDPLKRKRKREDEEILFL